MTRCGVEEIHRFAYNRFRSGAFLSGWNSLMLGIVYLIEAERRGAVMKKITCGILVAVVLLLGSAISGYAASHGGGGGWHGGGGSHGTAWHGGGGHWGHGGHGVFFGTRIFVGPGFWGPWWYGPAYPYYPYPYYAAPPAVVQQEPQVYIQQSEPQPQQPNYWYYCQNPQGYYPHVQQCPGGWMTVVPPTTAPPR